jgi:hypothetical protein
MDTVLAFIISAIAVIVAILIFLYYAVKTIASICTIVNNGPDTVVRLKKWFASTICFSSSFLHTLFNRIYVTTWISCVPCTQHVKVVIKTAPHRPSNQLIHTIEFILPHRRQCPIRISLLFRKVWVHTNIDYFQQQGNGVMVSVKITDQQLKQNNKGFWYAVRELYVMRRH